MNNKINKDITLQKKKLEFSKIIFILITLIILAVFIFSLVMIYQTKDLTPLAYLIPAVFAEYATTTGFYFSKAKAENKIKLLIWAKEKGINTEELLKTINDSNINF